MAINPFKETDLKELQQNVRQFFIDHFSGVKEKSETSWKKFREKGQERITVMFIPH